MQNFQSYERRVAGFAVHCRRTSTDHRKRRPCRLEKYSNTEHSEIRAMPAEAKEEKEEEEAKEEEVLQCCPFY